MKAAAAQTRLIWAGLLLFTPGSAFASGILFQDNFSVVGAKLDTSKWTTEIGPSSFLGRTQLQDWVSAGSAGEFDVTATGAQLALSTYNPTGFSLYGTQAKTLTSFLPTPTSAIVFDTKLQLTSVQPGIVYGMYLYGCVPEVCATQHDEIDIEIVTNSLQSGSPYQVQLNRYANEPLGQGNGGLVNLPSGFDPLALHDWTIRWSLSQIDYLVDGALLGSSTDHVPQGAMQVNEIAWGPDTSWAAAYSDALQPVNAALRNQTYVAELTQVTVSSVGAPEPGSGLLIVAGIVLAGLFRAGRASAGRMSLTRFRLL